MIRLCAFADEASASLQGQIEALKRNGISFIELRSIDGKNVSDFTEEEAKTYQKTLAENKISVWSIGSPLGKADIETDFAEYEKKIRHVCRLSQIFKTDKIRMFSFWHANEKEEKVYSYLRKMVEIGKEYGVYMCHENEKDIFGDIADRVQKIMENVDGLRYIYDPANFLQCGEPADKTLDLFHSKTEYFHIKDVIVESGALVPAGCGDGKIPQLIERITGDQVLTLEPHLAVFEAYKSIDNTEMKHKFTYASAGEAFDAAVVALKGILKEKGYKEMDGGFEK